jgi:hypothetical protein
MCLTWLQVLAEAIAETDPAIAQRAAEVEIARGAPERARLAVDALQKVATKSQRQPGAPAGGSFQEAARGPADGSGRPAEETMSFSAPPGDNNGATIATLSRSLLVLKRKDHTVEVSSRFSDPKPSLNRCLCSASQSLQYGSSICKSSTN